MATGGPWYVVVGFGLAFLAAGLLTLRVAYRTVRHLWRFSRTDVVDVAGIEPGGSVAVQGTAAGAGRTVRSEIADEDVLLRRTRIARRKRRPYGQPGERWDWFHDGYDAVPFDVEDDTGTVRVLPPDGIDEFGDLVRFRENVDPGGVEMVIDSPDEVPEGVEAYEESHHVRHSLSDPGRGKRVRERFVSPGDRVYVVGEATVDDDGRLVVSGRSDPDAFAVVHDWGDVERGRRRKSLLTAVVAGFFGLVATLGGAGVVVVGLLMGPL